MKKTFSILLIILPIFCFGQTINFSDINFKNALLNNNCVDIDNDGFPDTNADTNNDGEIQLTEAESIIGLHLSSSYIQSMNEISYFVNLQHLSVINNNLTSLDVSQLIYLVKLYVYNNYQLNSLILPQTNSLEELLCFNNILNSLDISNNTNLKILHCYNNGLTNLDISQNLILEDLQCGGISNPNLLTNIDLTQHINLKEFGCHNCLISNIDLSQNINLESLHLQQNNLTELDLSQNTSLNTLRCQNNELTLLNIKNGNNNFLSMLAYNNPNLTCIEVDDVNYANNSGWNINNTQAQYNLDCSNLSILEFDKPEIEIYPNPTKSKLNIKSKAQIEQVIIYSILGKFIRKELNTSMIDISEFDSGIYFLKIKAKNSISTIKIIKE